MLMPRIFRDTFFDDFMNDFAYPTRSANTCTSNVRNLMKTDAKETDQGYELSIELPGYKKEDVKIQLKDGYLTISAAKDTAKEEKPEDGKYVWQERYRGEMSRCFFVGKNISDEDIHARFEDGVLKVAVPKEDRKKVEENKYIAIEG